MGSGRGVTKRVRVSSAQIISPVAVYNYEKWAEFLEKSGLRNVKACKYYLGRDEHWTAYSEEEHSRLITDLFADAVTVGALELPDPYVAHDFKFRVRRRDGFVYPYVRMSPKKQPKAHTANPGFAYGIEETCALGGPDIRYSLVHMVRGVDAILAGRAYHG